MENGACPRAASHPAAPVVADNIASALCYLLLGVTGVLLLYLEPYRHNPRIRFHAFQSIFVNLAIIVFWMAISLSGRRLALLASPVFLLLCLVLPGHPPVDRVPSGGGRAADHCRRRHGANKTRSAPAYHPSSSSHRYLLQFRGV